MMASFAKNKVIVADASASPDINTDSITLDGLDRAFVVFDIHSIFGGGTLTYTVEVSNDGVTWTGTDAGFTDNTTTAQVKKKVGDVDGAFMRMNVGLANGAGGVGGAIFDLVVNLDKQ